MVLKKIIINTLMKPSILVGGQAVIEGVMMRVPGVYATAVRDAEGKIHVDKHDFTSRVEKSKIWKKPVFRGIISLFESLKMGMQTLQWSADIATPEEDKKKTPGKLAAFFTTSTAIILALVLFMAAPYWITTKLFLVSKEAFLFNLIAGFFRITFFILYLILISLMKDVKRLFQYHGAEHRVVYNFESGKAVTVKNAQSFPTQHPRCGTSFLFIVMISAIIIFSVIDTIFIGFFGSLTVISRILLHLLLMPLVAGIGYEVLKISARNGDNVVFRMLRAPGLWLQHITTKEPEDAMVEVSIMALKSAFGDRYKDVIGKKYVAEAIG
ncbi:DUF1385 domain-containing protein [bacterium]|nr:DUF1385 domain-containing protein [bacterium]